MSGFYQARDDGFDLFVRLTPKASADRVDGVETAADGRSHLAARVRAVPEKGAANVALERLVADHFGVARSKVAVVSGQTARLKTVRVEAGSSIVPALEELARPR